MIRSPDDISDELLVIRCIRRDVDAWDELVRRYSDRLFYYVRRLVDDDEQAAQLLQEVWLHVLRGIGSLRDAGRLAPWLYSIARHVVMSHFRERYSAAELASGESVDDVIDEEPDQSAQFENAELVHYGLSQIGWAEREVLTLFFLQDLSVTEIARVLNVPPGTVKSRMSRARAELRRVLEQTTGSPMQKVDSHEC